MDVEEHGAVPITSDMLDPNTPDSVVVRDRARAPVTDPTLGIAVQRLSPGTPRHRLVAIGDSLTHGFQSGAIYNTDLSYPMIIAWELGWDDHFRRPHYEGFGGLPLNIEYVLRRLEHSYGDALDWWEVPLAAFEVRQLMAEMEDWWERGPGTQPSKTPGIKHNLGVYGWDVRDVIARNADNLRASLKPSKNQVLDQLVEDHNARAALRVLDTAYVDGQAQTPVGAARALGAEGTLQDPASGDGIETLIVAIGANNALGAVVKLEITWSADGYDDLEKKSAFTVWRPDHFESELARLVAEVRTIRARHVIFATVPHVTIAPIARGVNVKVRKGSRYFPYYTRPWVRDDAFDPRDEPHITAAQARAVDSAIDQYNDAIVAAVKKAREDGLDWYVVELGGMLDRLASRRYVNDPSARPDWWTPYELPEALRALDPEVNSHFFRSGPQGRLDGGLFSLDGVHPTTIGYGLIAQEIVAVMQRAGVEFHWGNGAVREGPIEVDFERLLALDSLLSSPPRSLQGDLKGLGWIDGRFAAFKRMLRSLG